MRVELLTTGDELLSGQVVDTNSAWLNDRLWDLGLLTARVTAVGDDRQELEKVLREITARADLVVMSGGMGPTEDDLTAEAVASVLNVTLETDPASVEAMTAFFAKAGRVLSSNNLKQARFPAGARVMPNRWGTAPGFRVQCQRADLVCLPGVPVEYRGLCDEQLLPGIREQVLNPLSARVVKLIGVPESHADSKMRALMDDARYKEVRFGYRAHWPEVHIKWTVSGAANANTSSEELAEQILKEVRMLFGDSIWGVEKEELPDKVLAQLRNRHEKVALAESCTGGLLAELLTRVPGCSATFDLGLVTYANWAKTEMLGIPTELLADRGAVSEPCARAMAEAAKKIGQAHWGIGITGIAGPEGGTPEKPIGTVHMAVAGPRGTEHVKHVFRGDRDRVRRLAAYHALNLLRLATR